MLTSPRTVMSEKSIRNLLSSVAILHGGDRALGFKLQTTFCSHSLDVRRGEQSVKGQEGPPPPPHKEADTNMRLLVLALALAAILKINSKDVGHTDDYMLRKPVC